MMMFFCLVDDLELLLLLMMMLFDGGIVDAEPVADALVEESPPPSEAGSGRTQLVGKKPLSPLRSRVPFHWSKEGCASK